MYNLSIATVALLAAGWLPPKVYAQQPSTCPWTLGYLSSSIPQTGYQPLDTLRQQILAISVLDVRAKMPQNMTMDEAITWANKQADADQANLPTIEQVIRGSVQEGRGDIVMHGLKARDYSIATLGDDVLGAAERSYIADDWGQLANRETAKLLECVSSPSGKARDGLISAAASGTASESSFGGADSAGSSNGRGIDAARQLPATGFKVAGPSLEDTTKFIQDHVVVGQAINYFGTVSGDDNAKFKATRVWNSYAFEGCSLRALYHSDLSFYITDPGQEIRSVHGRGGGSKEELGKRKPGEVVVLEQAAVMRDEYREKGKRVSVATTPSMFIVGYRSTSKSETIEAVKPGPPPASLEEARKRPDLWKVTDTQVTETNTLFLSEDQELAGRIAKAFTHAIELCGGKAEPF